MAPILRCPTAAVVSDLHLGSPEDPDLEDFESDEAFEDFLGHTIPDRAGSPCSLVLAGDFIDFPQVLPELARDAPADRFGTTEAQSLKRLKRVLKGHPRVFKALGRFLDAGNQVVILRGNHDVDLAWRGVQERLSVALGGARSPSLVFPPKGELHERGLHVEHGHQHTFDNRFEHWEHPILEAPNGERRLERCWGTLFMDLLYNELEEKHPFLDQVHPRWRLALLILRNLGRENAFPLPVVAQVLAFFLRNGKRFLVGKLLGSADEEPGSEDPGEVLDRLAPDLEPARRQKILAATEAVLAREELSPAPPPGPGEEAFLSGLLGRSDGNAQRNEARRLLRQGDVQGVVMGHTHVPETRRPFGQARPHRFVNTGCWVPRLEIPSDSEPLTWADLPDLPRVFGLHYALVRFGDPLELELRAL